MRNVRRAAVAVVVIGVAVALVLVFSPVRTHDGVGCGSFLLRKSPDPTAEREAGCWDLFRDRGGFIGLTLMATGLLAWIVGSIGLGVTVLWRQYARRARERAP